MRRFFSTLTSRLVLTAVALVALVSILIGTVTTVAIDHQLSNQLDSDVRDLTHGPTGGPDTFGPGTLIVFKGTASATGDRAVVEGRYPGDQETLGTDAVAGIDAVPDDGQLHTVDVPDHGSYRVAAQPATIPDQTTGGYRAGVIVVGLPTADVDSTVENLVWWELALTLLGVVAAGLVGTAVVRRQLRPLREVASTAHAVAELPLSAGEIAITERVPGHLTDPRTEAGQVGAALNTLLEHVESSLDARHRSEQQVRQFVADASHELRTPLTTIAGYTELARKHPEAVDVALSKVDEESRRMTGLVEDLLLLARLDAGRPLEQGRVDLARLVTDAVDDARVVGPGHQWSVELPDQPALVNGDAGRLHQVVTNLLTNARKHTPPGTSVVARVTPSGFEVRDHGPGLPPELAAVAFQRFSRADVGRQRTGGAGLGLALVDAIVRAHGGTVRLASVPGDTRFEVALPPAAPTGSDTVTAG
ncbi:sensor histidine kinase [Nocardioides montaniterrae]